jgi:predicted protein tyrosine phosphatase
MVEIFPRLYVGNEADYESHVKFQADWWVVHACKEPYHRRLLGYKTRGAPLSHPEYLVAEREKRLFLNLVDADDPAYMPKPIFDAALAFIDRALKSDGRVLVHCNQGESRAPGIGLLYLAARTNTLPQVMAEAESAFRELYPNYMPKEGIRGFLRAHWPEYVSQGKGT